MAKRRFYLGFVKVDLMERGGLFKKISVLLF